MNNEKITRREALKCMGTTLAGLALTASGLSSITSCTEEKKRRLVFYFTGTGNCLYVARKFAENPLSIPQIIRQDKLEFEADEIGIVYPIYGHLAPQMVQEFIRKARLKAPYLFSILTYGNRKCSATELWNNLATENGTRFDYITTLKMVDNFLPSFDMNEQVKIDKQEDKQIAEIMHASTGYNPLPKRNNSSTPSSCNVRDTLFPLPPKSCLSSRKTVSAVESV